MSFQAFQPGANLYGIGIGTRPEAVEVPFITNRAPTINDVLYPIGKRWIYQGNSEFVLLSFTTSSESLLANWEIVAGSGLFPFTPFVVGPAGQSGYQTIQSAVNAAELNGGGIIYVQPGTYVENITITQAGIFIVGFIGCDGNLGITVTEGEILPVTIQGNITLNLVGVSSTPFLNFKNICFTGSVGAMFTITGNLDLLESGFITFDNCQLIPNALVTYVFFVDGFFNIGLQSCEIFEAIPNTVNFFTFGTTQFLNINARDSFISINGQNELVVSNSFMVFNLENTYYTVRMDVSSGSQALSFTALNCVFDPTPLMDINPLINFGANSGSVIANNCLIISTAGSLADSTDISAAAVFRYNNCVWNNSLSLGTNARGEFSFCEFYGGASPSIAMNSAQNIIVNESIVNSSHNPSITGTGTGILFLNDVTWTSNALVANTLTLGGTTFNPTTNTSLSTGTLSIKSTSAGSGNNTGFIELYVGGVLAHVPYFTNIAP